MRDAPRGDQSPAAEARRAVYPIGYAKRLRGVLVRQQVGGPSNETRGNPRRHGQASTRPPSPASLPEAVPGSLAREIQWILTGRYRYGPFGSTEETGAGGSNPFQYAGRENDGTGLYYYRARYYSPRHHRFISEDPIEFGDGVNLYAYVGNDPVNYDDPLGLQKGNPRMPPETLWDPHGSEEAKEQLLEMEEVKHLNNVIQHNIEAFEHTIACGKAVPVWVCYRKKKDEHTNSWGVTVHRRHSRSLESDLTINSRETLCIPRLAEGRKDCRPFVPTLPDSGPNLLDPAFVPAPKCS
jgi:RHS repeat-associated protein